jgi:KDO2-lipid IV(A) lauroyltransferase
MGILSIIGRIPWRLRQRIGYVIGWCIGALPLRETRIAKLQFQLFAPGTENPASATRRIFAHCGATVLESCAVEPILRENPSCISCSDWDMITSLLSDGKGLVALTGHYGNWELLAAYVASQNIPLTVVGRQTRQSQFHAEIARIRKTYGVKTVWRDSTSLAREIISDLKHGHVIAALIDQDTDVQSTFIPFFGVPASTPSSLVRLALRSGTPIVAAFLRRNSDYTFSVRITHLTDTQSTEQVLLQYHQLLEAEILADPHQWVWFHKRWRTTANKGKRPGKVYLQWLQEFCEKREPEKARQ